MKTGFLLLILIALAKGCHTKEQVSKPLLPTYQEVTINTFLKEILISFLNTDKCHSKYNEMFIDKISIDKTIITLRKRHYPKGEYGNPLYYTKVEDSFFFIYSGMESYFLTDMVQTDTAKFLQDTCDVVFWNLIDSAGHFTIIEEGSGIPFYELPDPNGEFK